MNGIKRALFVLATAAAFSGCTEAAVSSGFPAKYLGRWGEGAEGCSPGAVHGGLNISRLNVADGEFSGKVQSVSAKADGSLDVKELWDVPEEGPKTSVTNYRLSDDQNSLTVWESETVDGKVGEPITLIRCVARHG